MESALRDSVMERDGRECQFCGLTDEMHREEYDQGLHAHHVLPRRDGGDNQAENLLAVCTKCHGTLESVTRRALDAWSEAVNDQLTEMREHAQADRRRAIDTGDVPELRDGGIPTWRLEDLEPFERSLYLLGRAEALSMWANEIEGELNRSRNT